MKIRQVTLCGAALLSALWVTGCNLYSEAAWQEKLELGGRYLLESRYEQAVIAFSELIDIDPKRPEGYEKAAEAYIALENPQAAREILEAGFTAVESDFPAPEALFEQLYGQWRDTAWQADYDAGLTALSAEDYEGALQSFEAAIALDAGRPEAYEKAAETCLLLEDWRSAEQMLEAGFTQTGDPSVDPEILVTDWAPRWAYDEEKFLRPEELTLGGVPFYETTLEAVEAAYPGGRDITPHNGVFSEYSYYGLFCDPTYFIQDELHYDTFLRFFSIKGHSPDVQFQPEFRDLKIYDSSSDVLSRIGVTPMGIDYIMTCMEDPGSGHLGPDLEETPTANLQIVWRTNSYYLNHNNEKVDTDPYYVVSLRLNEDAIVELSFDESPDGVDIYRGSYYDD